MDTALGRRAGRNGNVLGNHHGSPDRRHGVLGADFHDLARAHSLPRHADGDLARAQIHGGAAGLLRDDEIGQLAHGDQGLLIEEEPGQGVLGRADAIFEKDLVFESEGHGRGLGARHGDPT